MTPEVYGQYVIKAKLGEGGMGVVYEAFHPKLEKRVALKTLHQRFAGDAELVTRFLREGRAAARIRHPHVVDVTDVGVADGMPYLVMELLEGESLAARIAKSAPLSASVTADILLPVCSALEMAHETGVLHRDLKPENVFLARSAGAAVVHPKILDFGIAVLTGDDLRITGQAALLGTPYYMSLEQARDTRSADARTDQYALGVIAYECLTGRRPFEGSNAAEVLTNAALEVPVPPHVLVPAISPALSEIVLRAMARSRDDRFPGVRELGTALLPHASSRGRAQWSPASGPLTVPPIAIAPEVSAEPAPRATGPHAILVIEDEEDIRENLVEMLEAEGFEAISARSGAEGIFELVTGELPFQATHVFEMVLKHATEPARDPRELRPDLPAKVAELVVRCLAKEPEARFESADAMHDAWRIAWGERPGSSKRKAGAAIETRASEPWAPPSSRAPSAAAPTGLTLRWWMLPVAVIAGAAVVVAIDGGGAVPDGTGSIEHVVTDPAPIPPPVSPEAVAADPPLPVPVTPASTRVHRLTSEPPGAEVLLDGESVGHTPFELTVAEGATVVIELRLAGRRRAERTLDGASPRDLHVRLARDSQAVHPPDPDPEFPGLMER